MISIGAQFGGPEHAQASIRRAIFTVMDAVRDACGERTKGAEPAVNTVVAVAGAE